MTDKIEPALSAEEWNEILPIIAKADTDGNHYLKQWVAVYVGDGLYAGAIAAANHALPDSNPRKITREMVRHLRETADIAADGCSGPRWLHDLADALESYLPLRYDMFGESLANDSPNRM